jgi:hypothetical protein
VRAHKPLKLVGVCILYIHTACHMYICIYTHINAEKNVGVGIVCMCAHGN